MEEHRVDPSSAVPLYFQVANTLQARIFSGAIAPGALLGTEKELAAEFGVSRITVRKAIELLRRDSLLEAERGRGTFVSTRARPMAPTAMHVFIDDILARAASLEVIDIDRAEVPADSEIARRFGLRAGATVVRIRRRMVPRTGGQGVWATYFVSRSVWRSLDAAGRDGALLPAIDRVEGLRLTQGREVIRAIAADDDTARMMAIAPGAAILRLERDYQTATGRTVVFGWVDRKDGALPVSLSRASKRRAFVI